MLSKASAMQVLVRYFEQYFNYSYHLSVNGARLLDLVAAPVL